VNHLDIALAARAFAAARAVRSSTVRHRRLVPKPIGVVLWQLGAEPFSAAAIGWGESHSQPHMAVAGEPRNRDLAFAALLDFAKWFNPRFEAHYADRETLTRGKSTITVARTAPQIVVANLATVELLGRLGRRLAYLPTDGPRPADPSLVRLGRHLRFLWDHCSTPGQQLVVAITDLMNAHWATPQSTAERQSLSSLDAFIEPPPGVPGFDAAAAAEVCPIGPAPYGDDEDRLMPLVERFNLDRKKSTDRAVVGPLLTPITNYYRPLLRRAWDMLWRCREREAKLPEARSVARRWDADRQAYTRHIDWLNRNGLRRTRQTPRQAAMTLRNLEEAGRLVEAEEACDDPLRMAAYVLGNKAVRGTITAVDPTHKEPGPKRMVCRPLVTLRSPDLCLIPVGRELWWTGQSDGKEFVVEEISPVPGGGSDVVLKLMTSSSTTSFPALGSQACFSIHSTEPKWLGELPDEDPWTHRAAVLPSPGEPIEDTTPQEV
jgi:hypothetical protein